MTDKQLSNHSISAISAEVSGSNLAETPNPSASESKTASNLETKISDTIPRIELEAEPLSEVENFSKLDTETRLDVQGIEQVLQAEADTEVEDANKVETEPQSEIEDSNEVEAKPRSEIKDSNEVEADLKLEVNDELELEAYPRSEAIDAREVADKSFSQEQDSNEFKSELFSAEVSVADSHSEVRDPNELEADVLTADAKERETGFHCEEVGTVDLVVDKNADQVVDKMSGNADQVDENTDQPLDLNNNSIISTEKGKHDIVELSGTHTSMSTCTEIEEEKQQATNDYFANATPVLTLNSKDADIDEMTPVIADEQPISLAVKIESNHDEETLFPTLIVSGHSNGFKVVACHSSVDIDTHLSTECDTEGKGDNTEVKGDDTEGKGENEKTPPLPSYSSSVEFNTGNYEEGGKEYQITTAFRDDGILCCESHSQKFRVTECSASTFSVERRSSGDSENSESTSEKLNMEVDSTEVDDSGVDTGKVDTIDTEVLASGESSTPSAFSQRDYEVDDKDYITVNSSGDYEIICESGSSKFRITDCRPTLHPISNEIPASSEKSELFSENFDAEVDHVKEVNTASAASPVIAKAGQSVNLVLDLSSPGTYARSDSSQSHLKAIACDENLVVNHGSKFVVQLLKSTET